MPFETNIIDYNTGEKKRVYVSLFIFKNGKLVEIHNVKSYASEETASEAREELNNFIKFVEAMKKFDEYKNYSIGDDNNKIKIKDIDVSKIKKVTVGPSGSRKFGFDIELDLPEEAFRQVLEKK